MAEEGRLRDPWLLAVWPGMGSVAMLAGSHLLRRLKPRRAAELNAHDFFEVQAVDVTEGIATAAHLPRNVIFEWRDPAARHDLLIFLGEAQPARGGELLCQMVLDYAIDRGVRRLFTFAAMATGLELGSAPRTLAAATDRATLAEATAVGAAALEGGQIGGLNGALLAAGVERHIPGICLLGEIPYFAAQFPFPRAAQVVLERFAEISGIPIDVTELTTEAEEVEQKLAQMLEQVAREAEGIGNGTEEGDIFTPPEATATPPAQEEPPPPRAKPLDEKTRQKLEGLFEAARRDRGRAVELKKELDRLGVFRQYEDRFLDLFRRAE
jgi:hypothetical protein